VSRRAGQLRTPAAVAGLAVAALVVVGVVALCEWLVFKADELPGEVRQEGVTTESLTNPAGEQGPPATGGECPPTPPPGGEPPAVASTQLMACPEHFDGRVVSYTGEVILGQLRRDEGAWVQLNDDPYALQLGPLRGHRITAGTNSGIPVLIPADSASAIETAGGPDARGDLLAVEGTFRRAASADGGGPAIVATSATVVEEGHPIRRPADGRRVAVAGVLAAVTAVVAGATAAASRR
jgi:hypothetical protein